jgi:iron complex outermembrane receptor protein
MLASFDRIKRVRLSALLLGGVCLLPGFAAAAEAGSETQFASETEQVVITGSRLPAAQTQSSQDVHIYELPRIEQSGQSNVTDFLNSLPEVSLNSVDSTFVGTTVRLRGAPAGSALVLINGRRVESVTGGVAPFGFFDLNTIPLALVQRIEVLPTGSSAIYGGDALAGVVNIVLRSDFNGFEADGGYKFADDTDEKILSLGGGYKADAFAASIMATFSDQSALLGKDREITSNPDLRRFGGPNLGSQILGVPATVSSLSGNLPGLNASMAAVPVGSTGIGLTPASFAATAGKQNTGSFTRYQSTIPEEHKAGLFASASYRFMPSFELFTEFLQTAYKMNFLSAPPFVQLASLPASNPFNPFGATVRISGVVQGAESLSRFSYNEDFIRPLVGARGDLGDWSYELTVQTSRDRGERITYGATVTPALNAALASSNPATALNPFVDGPWASTALLDSIYSGVTPTSTKSHSNIVDGFARGPLFDLPGGPLDAVIGGEYEASGLSRGFLANRTVKSGFAELRAPLGAVDDDRGGRRELVTLDSAVRYDDYSDFGSETTWQAGLEFRPLESLLLRGTHATAYKPPTLNNIGQTPLTNPIAVMDPLLGNQLVVVPITQGGNQHLEPTTGTTTTAGFVWSPQSMQGFNLSLTDWHLRIENAISLPQAQFIVNNANLFPGRVTRAAAPAGQVGQITAIDGTFINFGLMRESGVDVAADWTFATDIGQFTPAIAATYMTEYKGASTPGAPIINRLSRANNDGNWAPRLKGTASIAWAPEGPFKLWFAGRYVGRYTDYTPPRQLGDIWYFDATLEVDLVRALNVNPAPVNGIKLLVSATNLADTLPSWSSYFRGYDPFNYDIVGRTIFVRLQIQT